MAVVRDEPVVDQAAAAAKPAEPATAADPAPASPAIRTDAA
jgi:hypothetical protein